MLGSLPLVQPAGGHRGPQRLVEAHPPKRHPLPGPGANGSGRRIRAILRTLVYIENQPTPRSHSRQERGHGASDEREH
jgi:hypothetical protein